jgi:hypothetical protein
MSMTEGVGTTRNAREDTTMGETDQDLAFGEYYHILVRLLFI